MTVMISETYKKPQNHAAAINVKVQSTSTFYIRTLKLMSTF